MLKGKLRKELSWNDVFVPAESLCVVNMIGPIVSESFWPLVNWSMTAKTIIVVGTSNAMTEVHEAELRHVVLVTDGWWLLNTTLVTDQNSYFVSLGGALPVRWRSCVG